MASKEVKLLGSWPSPFVFRIKLALKLKGVDYEYAEENLGNKSSLLLETNPIHKKVPVLIHGGKPICESFVILEYIDETWKKNPIFPEDPYEKAMVRFWGKFAEDKLTECIRRILLSEGEEQAAEVKQAQEALKILDNELENKKKYFGGEAIGYLDIVLGFTAHWLETIEEAAEVKVFDSQTFPFFNRWMKEVGEIHIVKEMLPPKGELLSYLQYLRQLVLASKASK